MRSKAAIVRGHPPGPSDVRVVREGMRVAELGPPQKSRKLNQRGRTLKITTAMLVQGSCGIARPFGDPKKLHTYLAAGDETKLRRRLEADVKSLFALYQYGRLHGAVRLKWGFLDERIMAPWVHMNEPQLYTLKEEAPIRGVPLEVVAGSAPGWADPWARAQPAIVMQDPRGFGTVLVNRDGFGFLIDQEDVQLARISGDAEDGS